MAANRALYLQRSGGTFRDVMAVRMVIEPEIAAEATAHHRHDAMALAAVSPEPDEDAPADRLVAEAADFYDLVATSTGNGLFEGVLLALHRITEPLACGLEYSPERRSELVESHAAVAAAIAGVTATRSGR